MSRSQAHSCVQLSVFFCIFQKKDVSCSHSALSSWVLKNTLTKRTWSETSLFLSICTNRKAKSPIGPAYPSILDACSHPNSEYRTIMLLNHHHCCCCNSSWHKLYQGPCTKGPGTEARNSKVRVPTQKKTRKKEQCKSV